MSDRRATVFWRGECSPPIGYAPSALTCFTIHGEEIAGGDASIVEKARQQFIEKHGADAIALRLARWGELRLLQSLKSKGRRRWRCQRSEGGVARGNQIPMLP